MIEQPGLFDEQEAVGPVTTGVIKALVEDDWQGAVDPRTNLPFNDDVIEEFRDGIMFSYRRPGNEVEVKGLGKFVFLATWGENTDNSPNGFVFKDLNTLNEYMITYTYSSWDSPYDYEVVLAESYTFSETRWRKKR